MSRPTRPIFRADAVRRYAESREKAVLPQFIAPRSFLWLWLVAALLLGSVALVGLARVPVYASGPAVVLDPQDRAPTTADSVIAAVLLPPETIARLQVGQSVFMATERSGAPLRGSLVALDSTILSPDAIQRQFPHTSGVAQAADRPSAVALARLDLPPHLPAAAYSGSRYQVNAEVGSRRVLAFLPVFSRLFGE